jgi:YfiH family protein
VSVVKSPQGYYQSTVLGRFPWLWHAFGTAAAPPPAGYLVLKQIHSNLVLTARECGPGVEGDALVTAEPGVVVAAKTADCVPLLMADARLRAVAAVHAGWKGTLADIAGAAVRKLRTEFGSRPEDIWVAIGPSIGACCFEVGPEVAHQFGTLFPERDDLHERTRVDLRESNRRLLVEAGVPAAQIDVGAACTVCGGAEFYSWRRDKVAGERMFAVIGVRAEG